MKVRPKLVIEARRRRLWIVRFLQPLMHLSLMALLHQILRTIVEAQDVVSDIIATLLRLDSHEVRPAALLLLQQ